MAAAVVIILGFTIFALIGFRCVQFRYCPLLPDSPACLINAAAAVDAHCLCRVRRSLSIVLLHATFRSPTASVDDKPTSEAAATAIPSPTSSVSYMYTSATEPPLV
jgi:hypothetical protein